MEQIFLYNSIEFKLAEGGGKACWYQNWATALLYVVVPCSIGKGNLQQLFGQLTLIRLG